MNAVLLKAKERALDKNNSLASFRNVQKSYDGRTLVVKDLNLDVTKGEFLTLLGPSGSGKTTTLMMLAGFETPTAGTIHVGGHDITRLPPSQRGIGVVFQNYALFPHMSVAENIAYPLRVRKIRAAEAHKRVENALALVRLAGFGGRRPSQLSGGQQQRVALARALVFEPPLVLLDEPLGALDKQLREEMQMELKQIHEDLGITMVYVTHDQSEALTMSDRVAVFNNGRIEQLDTAIELYERPDNAFVAQFVGENNRLHGQVRAVRDRILDIGLEDGTVIKAQTADVLAVGDQVEVSLRPERIRILEADMSLDNSFAAIVDKLVYLGDITRLICTINDAFTLVSKVSNDSGLINIERGQRVQIGWRSTDARAFAKVSADA